MDVRRFLGMPKQRPQELSAEDALEELDAELGSGSDPIWWHGEETTPGGMVGRVSASEGARFVRITYYGREPTRLVNGTLSGMVRDRRKLL